MEGTSTTVLYTTSLLTWGEYTSNIVFAQQQFVGETEAIVGSTILGPTSQCSMMEYSLVVNLIALAY